MRPVARFLLCTLLLSVVIGCASDKTPTPPAIEAQFYALLDSLGDGLPGASAARLGGFLRNYDGFQIADTVQTEIDRFRAAAVGRYQEARELARQGQYDRAERMLDDLATNLADTPEGDTAKRHLQFEFYFGKAKWLMYQQRFAECEEVSRDLLERDLTLYQVDQVQAILDNLAHVDVAVGMSERSSAENACRQLTVMLANQFVEEGRYPSRLSLKDVEGWGPHNSEFILRGLSAIEDYKTSNQSFSFVGVSKQGRHRIHVVDGRIK